MTDSVTPFACDMNAIEPANRERHITTTLELFQTVQAIQELSDGYAFRLPGVTALLPKTAEFIANERLCCPFFGFTLAIEPDRGPIWLSLTGPDGVKPFIQAEIGEALTHTMAQAAGFR